MALVALGLLPPEHLHEAAEGGHALLHRHAIDEVVPTGAPVVHAADHSTVKLIATVFEAAPDRVHVAALTVDANLQLPDPDSTPAGRLLANISPPIHGPPPQPGPSRAPPRS